MENKKTYQVSAGAILFRYPEGAIVLEKGRRFTVEDSDNADLLVELDNGMAGMITKSKFEEKLALNAIQEVQE